MPKRLSTALQEPPVMWVIVFINCALFGLVWSKDPTISAQTLREYGAQFNPSIWAGEPYRLLLAGFLHGSLTHLVMNNLSLYFLGKLLEQLLGSRSFFILYILSLLAGSAASLFFMPPMAVSVGASGAIMGLAGALFALLLLDRRGRFLTARPFGRYLFFVMVLFYLVIGKIFPVINTSAHVGGFLMGCIFGIFFWSRIPGEKVPRWVGSALLLSSVVGLSVATLYGMNPKNTHAWHLYQGLEGYQKGNNQDAVRHLKLAIQQQSSKQALRYLGQLYFYTKQFRKSAEIYAQLLKKSPSDFGNWYYRIVSLHKSKQPKLAEQAYQKASAYLKKQAKSRSWLRSSRHHEQEMLWRWAHLLAAHQKEKQALLYYQQLLEQFSNNVSLHNEKAWLLLTATNPRYRNPALALRHARIATDRTENPPAGFLDTLATALFLNGRTKDAIHQAKRALRAPGAKEIMPHLRQQLQRFKAGLKKKASHPTTHKPTTHKPTTHKPTPHKPTPHKPTPHKPTPHKPTTHKPTPHKPISR